MSNNIRALAAETLVDIIERGQSLDKALESRLGAALEARDRAFLQTLVYGVVRWYGPLDAQLASLLRKRLRKKDRDLEILALVGLYQILHLETPEHAAVDSTVSATKTLNKAWARGLINGVLRNATRRRQELTALVETDANTATAHPAWLLERLKQDWPNQWTDLIAANNAHPPLSLRVNHRRISRDDYLKLLIDAGIDAVAGSGVAAIHLPQAIAVTQLPRFDQGFVSVQDEAAQLALSVLDLSSPARVLDACAAPGGKCAHVLEAFPDGVAVTAIEKSATRSARLKSGLARLGLDATVHELDACATQQWWDGVPFDRILIDAPCSGTGVIRRHPDIKLHRRASDIPSFAQEQLRLLNSLWPLLRSKGKLVYATCSVLKAENDAVISAFADQQSDNMQLETIDASWGVTTQCGRQILTGSGQMDGFYYARLQRR